MRDVRKREANEKALALEVASIKVSLESEMREVGSSDLSLVLIVFLAGHAVTFSPL